MEDSISFKEEIIHMFNSGKSEINGDFKGIITKISYLYDKAIINIIMDKIEYKELYLLEGEIFPKPKKGDNIRFKKVKILYDIEDNYNLKIIIGDFIEVKNDEKSIYDNNIKEFIDFGKNSIYIQLKKLLKIKEESISLLCIYDEQNNKNNDKIELMCLTTNKKYSIDKSDIKNLEKNNYIYILNCSQNEKNEIKKNKLTHIEILKDDALFKFLDQNENFESCFFGKIIDIIDNLEIISSYKKILFIDNNNNLKWLKISEKNKNYLNFELYKLCFITNCEIKDDNIIINNNSYIYFSSQNIYFDNLKINNNSIIEFTFPDYDIKYNFYDTIEVKYKQEKIKNNILYITFETYYKYSCDFFPVNITLINTEKKIQKQFKFILIHGVLNRINCFINYSENDSFFYELFYYSFISYGLPFTINTEVKGHRYLLNKFDSFDSKKRRRFNLLNVPKIKEYSIPSLESNSFQICRIYINMNKCIDFGLFNIYEINTPFLVDNIEFDKYFDKFGGVLDYLLENKDHTEEELINYCEKIINSEPGVNKYINFYLSSNCFEEKMTLSQFKSRIGIILCYYIPKCKSYLIKFILSDLKNLYQKAKKYLLQYYEIINILYFYIKERINESKFQILFEDELNENSPYKLAYENNKNEIKFLTEDSCLFFCYLQLDGYIVTNYLKKNKKSYLFSMESLFILKNHLLQQYKKYFVLIYTTDDFLAKYDLDFQLTLLNENYLFPDFNPFFVKEINDSNSKDLAVPISSSFRHENNGHSKKNIKNKKEDSPVLVCKNNGPSEIHDLSNDDIGESGLFIESFIGTQEEMYQIDFSRHLGEILDYKYFINESFEELKEKIKSLESLKKQKPSVQKIVFKLLSAVKLKKKGITNQINKEKIIKKEYKYNKRKYSRCLRQDRDRLENCLMILREMFPDKFKNN